MYERNRRAPNSAGAEHFTWHVMLFWSVARSHGRSLAGTGKGGADRRLNKVICGNGRADVYKALEYCIVVLRNRERYDEGSCMRS